MKNRKSIGVILFSALILYLFPGRGIAATGVDNTIYASLLRKYVAGGRVDYKGFQTDEARLDQYLVQLGRVTPDRLERNDRMAFYINLYNAATIKLILTAYPDIKSIKDLGSLFRSPWKKKFITLNGQTISLDHIEHDILRPRFKDPRVHFAINCASKSCPPLLDEPYAGDTLNAQLEKAATNFINDPHSTYVKDGALYVSSIFKWFGKDFGNDIEGFVAQYAQGDFKRKLQAKAGSLRIEYLDYDWSLNGS